MVRHLPECPGRKGSRATVPLFVATDSPGEAGTGRIDRFCGHGLPVAISIPSA